MILQVKVILSLIHLRPPEGGWSGNVVLSITNGRSLKCELLAGHGPDLRALDCLLFVRSDVLCSRVSEDDGTA